MIVSKPFRYSGLPVISIKDFYKFSNKKKIVKEILSQMLEGGCQFKLKSTKNYYSLYKKFVRFSEDKFGNLNITSDMNIWALCTNKDNWKSKVHNHIKTSTINSVYYLNIPKLDFKNQGAIKLYYNEKWYNYIPSENELLIFPNYLTHDTEYNKTNDFRISINMEIKCNDEIDWSL